VRALSIWFAVLEFTDDFVPKRQGQRALSIWVVILEFTDVFLPIRPGMRALSNSPIYLSPQRTHAIWGGHPAQGCLT
jgi:hypothetical protein